MEQPLPAPDLPDRALRGWFLSGGLHALMLAMALWYLAVRPALPPMTQTLPVELVTLAPVSAPAPAPGPAGQAAPRPAMAPTPQGTRPDAAKEPEDELTARLEVLSRLSAPDTALAIGPGNGQGAGSGDGAGGGLSLRDYVRAQILRRWLPDLSSGNGGPVMLRVTITDRGIITDVTVLERQQFNDNRVFRNAAISARNAALLTSPVTMPPGRWPRVTTLEIALDPKDASR